MYIYIKVITPILPYLRSQFRIIACIIKRAIVGDNRRVTGV